MPLICYSVRTISLWGLDKSLAHTHIYSWSATSGHSIHEGLKMPNTSRRSSKGSTRTSSVQRTSKPSARNVGRPANRSSKPSARSASKPLSRSAAGRSPARSAAKPSSRSTARSMGVGKASLRKGRKTLRPGHKTPTDGEYGRTNARGRKTGTKVASREGNPLPPTPRRGQGYKFVGRIKRKKRK